MCVWGVRGCWQKGLWVLVSGWVGGWVGGRVSLEGETHAFHHLGWRFSQCACFNVVKNSEHSAFSASASTP